MRLIKLKISHSRLRFSQVNTYCEKFNVSEQWTQNLLKVKLVLNMKHNLIYYYLSFDLFLTKQMISE
jgi:hypothetical protein